MEGFLSTLPVRGATDLSIRPEWDEIISIHAPREGSDAELERMAANLQHFYPRSP